MRVSEYYWYDPWNPEDFAGFSLHNGRYESKLFNDQGWLLSNALGLALVRWPGNYRGVETIWLRWATLKGEILPIGKELAQQEHQRAELLAEKLRQLGIDPDSL